MLFRPTLCDQTQGIEMSAEGLKQCTFQHLTAIVLDAGDQMRWMFVLLLRELDINGDTKSQCPYYRQVSISYCVCVHDCRLA